jgi:hypothetical protein
LVIYKHRTKMHGMKKTCIISLFRKCTDHLQSIPNISTHDLCTKYARQITDRNQTFLFDGDNIVGIATLYELEGLAIESRWGRNFPHRCIPAM